MIGIKYRDHCVKLKIEVGIIPPTTLLEYVSKIEHLKYPYSRYFFFLNFFDLWYMFSFFPEHINYKKKKKSVNDCINMIEIRYRDHCVKLKIPGWYYSPNYFVRICVQNRASQISIYSIFFFEFFVFWYMYLFFSEHLNY